MLSSLPKVEAPRRPTVTPSTMSTKEQMRTEIIERIDKLRLSARLARDIAEPARSLVMVTTDTQERNDAVRAIQIADCCVAHYFSIEMRLRKLAVEKGIDIPFEFSTPS